MSNPIPEKQSNKPRLVIFLIAASLLYFAVGGCCVWFGILLAEKYALIGGLVGSVASILSLISLARPALTQADISKIEIESLQKLAETSAELKHLENIRIQEIQRLETTRVVTTEQIEQLKQQKQEMEYLVRKASLLLLLQEQHKGRVEQVLVELDNAPVLKSLLNELQPVEHKLRALEQEVESSPHVELLRSVIDAAQRKDDAVAEFINKLPPFTRMLFRAYVEIPRDLVRLFTSSLRR